MSSSPAELAALIAREADLGVAGALGALDAAGVLTLETIIARVADVPNGPDGTPRADNLDHVVWQAEVVMRPGSPDPRGVTAIALSDLVADLPVSALKGVGPAWRVRLEQHDVRTVGQLAVADPSLVAKLVATYGAGAAELAGRARSGLGGDLPPGLTDPAWARFSVLEVATGDPSALPGGRPVALAAWNMCLRLAAAVDAEVLAGLPLAGLVEG